MEKNTYVVTETADYRTTKLGDRCVMRVVYSDETGTHEAGKAPFTVVVGVMLNMDTQWVPVARDLDTLAPGSTYEFKGNRLFKDLCNAKYRDDADRILRGVLSIILAHGVSIFHGACDRLGYERAVASEMFRHQELFSPNEIAFVDCLQAVNAYVHAGIPQEKVLWIADRSRYDGLLKEHLERFRRLQLIDKSRWLPDEMKNLDGAKPMVSPVVDTVYFGNSHESRALQLADVCCAIVSRHLRGDALAESYYDVVRRQIITQLQEPVFSTGAVINVGHELIPKEPRKQKRPLQ